MVRRIQSRLQNEDEHDEHTPDSPYIARQVLNPNSRKHKQVSGKGLVFTFWSNIWLRQCICFSLPPSIPWSSDWDPAFHLMLLKIKEHLLDLVMLNIYLESKGKKISSHLFSLVTAHTSLEVFQLCYFIRLWDFTSVCLAQNILLLYLTARLECLFHTFKLVVSLRNNNGEDSWIFNYCYF